MSIIVLLALIFLGLLGVAGLILAAFGAASDHGSWPH
jgi:hypothetical protein